MNEGVQVFIVFNVFIVGLVGSLLYFVNRSANQEKLIRKECIDKAKDIYSDKTNNLFNIIDKIFLDVKDNDILKILSKKESQIILPNFPFINKILIENNIEPNNENRIIYGFVVYFYLQDKYLFQKKM